MSKTDLRNQYKKVREELYQQQDSAKKLEKLLEKFSNFIDEDWASKVIAIYMAMPNEIDLISVMRERSEIKWCLPAIIARAQPLIFYPYKFGDRLRRSEYYRIFEVEDREAEVVPDIVVCPFIACDWKGNRLGYGKGFYDYTIEHLRKGNSNLVTIGVSLEELVVEELPSEEHDQKLNYLITEENIYRMN